MPKVATHEAGTELSELLARAEKGEVFDIMKNGRPVARLVPVGAADRLDALATADRLRAWLQEGQRVSEEQAQDAWDQLKRELDEEDERRDERWLSSSMLRYPSDG